MDVFPITFDLNPAGQPMTTSGKRVTCDGCGVELGSQPTPEQQAPVPASIAQTVYGRGPGELVYVACKRGVDCLTLAVLDDELHASNMCKAPGCNGDRCDVGRLPIR